MINPTLHFNKSLKEKAETCINNKFSTRTQHFIKNVMTKNNTCVLSLITFHDTRKTKAKKYLIVLICVIYTIIDNFFCIDDLAFQYKQLSEICLDGKYLVKYFNEFLGIDIPDLFINLLLFHGFTKNIKYTFILKCPKGCWNIILQKDLVFCNAIRIIQRKFQMLKNKEFTKSKHIIQTML